MTWFLHMLWLVLFLDTEDPDTDGEEDKDTDKPDEDDLDTPKVELDEEGNPKLTDVERFNSRIHDLSQEAGRWRLKFKAVAKELNELKSIERAESTSRVEAAFWRSLVVGPQRISDHETALDLFLSRKFVDLVQIDAEGNVSGMDDAMEKLVSRYPFLANGDGPRDGDIDLPTRRTASPPRKKKDSGTGPTKSELSERMPALRRRRR